LHSAGRRYKYLPGVGLHSYLHAGRKALTLYSVPPLDETPDSPQLAKVAGFSLHAATVCEAWQRNRLEHLCRYITRPPVATKRLSGDGQGRVVYRYKQPFRDGSTHVVLEPLDFMYRMYCMPRAQGCAGAAIARLVALVPRPRLNLTRFHSAGESSRTVRPQGVSEAAKP
jgi:hypothetical protein